MLDLKNPASQQMAMEAFFFGYQAFTAKADEMLERRGLSRVHQRIVFFIARYPSLSVKELLTMLGVSKQALNMPRSEERRVGKECVSTCRSRGSPDHYKKQATTNIRNTKYRT